MAPAPEADREEEEELGTRGPLPGQLKMNGEDGGGAVSNGAAMGGGGGGGRAGNGEGGGEAPLPVLSHTHSEDMDSETGTEENRSRKPRRSGFKKIQMKLKDLVRITIFIVCFSFVFFCFL